MRQSVTDQSRVGLEAVPGPFLTLGVLSRSLLSLIVNLGVMPWRQSGKAVAIRGRLAYHAPILGGGFSSASGSGFFSRREVEDARYVETAF